MPRSGLVPTLPSEFNKSAYWESFFKKRTRAFEWYGTYYELCGILHRYIKPTDNVLMAGCGNSELSENMFDAGLKKIVNIDISQTVIDQMLRRKGDRDTLEYMKMDLTDLRFDPDTFSAIVDKGTLDAIMSDDSEKSHETTDKIFSEYSRVLKNGGRYICVTLAQDFILKKIMTYFPDNGWLVRLHRVFISSDDDSSSDLPVFAFVMTKFKNLPKKILEICKDDTFTPVRMDAEKQITDFVKSQQYYVVLKSNLTKEVHPGKENPPIELFSTTNSIHPRFVMRIVDNHSFKLHCMFAVFIVPQGRENEWMFATHEGRMKVAGQTPFRRVLFVSLHPEHQYGSRENLHQELNSTVMDFGPPGIKPGDNVPYLSTSAEDIGQRVVRFKGESAITGPYLVEDYLKDGNVWYRHLLFTKRESVIQCEIRLKQKGQQNTSKKSSKNRKAVKQSDSESQVPDHTYLASQYAEAAVAGLVLRYKPEDSFKMMIIGIGGGTLTSFVLHNFKNCNVTAVEIDSSLIEIGNAWFGLPKPDQEPRLEMKIADGVEFVKSERSRLQQHGVTSGCYDVVFIDVDVKDPSLGISCPPAAFVEEEYLKSLTDILAPDGLFMVNLLSRSDQIKKKVMYNFRKLFQTVGKFRCDSYYNELVYCWKQKPQFGPEKSTKSARKKNRKKKNQKSQPVKKSVESADPQDDTNIGDAAECVADVTKNVEEMSISSDVKELAAGNGISELPDVASPAENQAGNPVLSAAATLGGDFVPPIEKKPFHLENYNSNFFNTWVEKASFWERYWTENFDTCAVDLSGIVPNIMIEQEVDYYAGRQG